MINASFVFGLDDDRADVFDRTVDWAVSQSVETATFHIMTPYPGTALHARVAAEGRITDDDWDHYDTRHVVFRPRHLTPDELLAGYRRAYRRFYGWPAILRGAAGQPNLHGAARQLAYAGGWKRFEPFWDLVIRARRVNALLPLLEATLDAFGGARRARGADPAPVDRAAIPSPAAIPSGQIVARATILCEDGAVRGAERAPARDSPGHHGEHMQFGIFSVGDVTPDPTTGRAPTRARAHRGDDHPRPQGGRGRPRRLRHRRAPQPAVRAVVADDVHGLRRRQDVAPDPLDRDDADHDQRPGQDRRGLRLCSSTWPTAGST